MRLMIAEFYSILIKKQERNIRVLLKFLLVLSILISIYSVAFHFVMLSENREYSWITGFYWTLTVMSTLGFGDITFHSDLGRFFSIIVLLSGIIFLLTMLPFIFIRFLYMPWLESQTRARTIRKISPDTKRHVILTNYDPIAINLIDRLKQYDHGYVIIIRDVQKAIELHDQDWNVVVGEPGNPETYLKTNVLSASLLFANMGDMINTNIAFTVREISQDIPIVANADLDESVDILELAGANHVFQFMKTLGRSMAGRVLGASARANVIGNIDSLLIAEASAMGTLLEGITIKEASLRERVGASIVGLWKRGEFHLPSADTVISPESVLLLAGSEEQLKNYDNHFSKDQKYEAPVLILGGGRVGRAAAGALDERNMDYRIIEKDPELVTNEKYIQGSAANINILTQAGIDKAPSALITTSDDAANIYLTIYCRKLRPDIQIITRANFYSNVSTLHKAGADLVMSYSTMAANMILNILRPGELLMLAEGLNVFQVQTPPSLLGKSLVESRIGERTGCNVIAAHVGDTMIINPDSSFRFQEGNEIIIIGDIEAEKRFLQKYSETKKLKSP